jgi:hypothetical protein
MQANLSAEMNEADLRYWHIWDEDGFVDPGSLRDTRDGERFAVLLQPHIGKAQDIEQKTHPEQAGSEIQRFIKHTRWRRLKSRYNVEIERPDVHDRNLGEALEEVSFCSVDERIQKKSSPLLEYR